VWQCHTSEMHLTVDPLNSWLSSFSTAAARSAAVSYSTKLECICQRTMLHRGRLDLPFAVSTAVTLASDLAVDDVEAGLTGEVLEIL
jgi:hypothetical protein